MKSTLSSANFLVFPILKTDFFAKKTLHLLEKKTFLRKKHLSYTHLTANLPQLPILKKVSFFRRNPTFFEKTQISCVFQKFWYFIRILLYIRQISYISYIL